MRFEDTATAAAALWLREEPALSPEQVREDHEDWSGQWLHWQTREQDADERPVPDDTWKVILDKRRRQGYPSAYYAVLMLDADRMGDRLLAARDPEDHRRTSRTLATFALHKVRPIVEDRHFGQLIYAGGDDVLAVLPTRTALACARDLNKEFHDNWRLDAKNGQPLTLSAGLAVAHYKEDLRFVLGEAHAAEKQAKTLGRNALFVRVCRRSGEHSGALCPWGFVEQLIAWEEAFRKGASDRWAYHLKRDLETLQGLDAPAVDALVRRQVGRAEERTSRLLGGPEGVEGALHLYRELDATREPPRPESDRIADFVTLCQTASFLAREKEG
jgi:CRISPR-associated protein Cmr2